MTKRSKLWKVPNMLHETSSQVMNFMEEFDNGGDSNVLNLSTQIAKSS